MSQVGSQQQYSSASQFDFKSENNYVQEWGHTQRLGDGEPISRVIPGIKAERVKSRISSKAAFRQRYSCVLSA
jgi:hypothetical protein